MRLNKPLPPYLNELEEIRPHGTKQEHTDGATLHGHERGLLWRQQRPSVLSCREGRRVIPASGLCRLALYSVVSLPQTLLA